MGDTESFGKNYYTNRRKRMKRSKFLQNAKSFGRKNIFGRGTELDQESYNYYLEILNSLKTQQDIENKEIMAANVFKEAKGKEIKSSSNQVGSKVLEDLLPYTDIETFEYLLETFTENFRVLCTDKFASHVLQKALFTAFLRAVSKLQETSSCQPTLFIKKSKNEKILDIEHNMKTLYSDEHTVKCCQFVEKLSRFLLNNLEEFLCNIFANYVIREAVQHLAGIIDFKNVDYSPSASCNNKTILIVPEEWSSILNDYIETIEQWPQFDDLPYNENTSILLQDLLTAANSIKTDKVKSKSICKKLLKESFLKEYQHDEISTDQFQSPKVFAFQSSIRLLEVVITVVADEKLYNKYFIALFSGKLAKLSNLHDVNYVIQKFIDFIHTKEMFEIVFTELEDEFENIIRNGFTGIIASISKSCVKFGTKQQNFAKLLFEALKCTDASEKLIMSILKLLPASVLDEHEAAKIHINGSIILQSLLNFNKPIKIVQTLLDMSADKLCKIFIDPKGSYVINAFTESKFVGEKSKLKMAKRLEGYYVDMALSIHGSRALELIFFAASDDMKKVIVKELSERISQLNSKPCGTIINQKFMVDVFRKNPTLWVSQINQKSNKTDKMFDKILK